MQVSRSTFHEQLPAVKAAIARCQFAAFDCEFTGLHADPSMRETGADNLDDRVKVRGGRVERRVERRETRVLWVRSWCHGGVCDCGSTLWLLMWCFDGWVNVSEAQRESLPLCVSRPV